MSYTTGDWVRTCQECGHKQKDTKPPESGMTEAYRSRKCRKCKSSALDYGSTYTAPEDQQKDEE